MFRAYWALELDPNDQKAVSRIIGDLGADRAAFEAWAADRGPESVSAVAEEFSEHGFAGVPAYLVDGEVFLGRQHRPMI